MTDQEVLELLRKIDDGYEPIEAEKKELASIARINWKQIEKVPKHIDVLTGLRELDISGDYFNKSNLMDLPERIKNLPSLQLLDLSSTQIGTLPESIGNMPSLVFLSLSNTQVRMLPESIGNLSSLQLLDLSKTQIRTLPESIGNLLNLQDLFLGKTQIGTLPESIGKLSSLRSLSLSKTQIRTLPESMGNLKSLKSLNLSSIPTTEFPRNIATLPELKRVVLENLTLSELPEELLSLNLDFRNERYVSWKEKTGIYICGLRLQKQPVSLFYQPRELIIDYYRQPHIPVNETKVIFLGSEGVGKTHTITRILNDNHKIEEDLKETPGISITSKEFFTDNTSYRINFWDFGGQEIMHAMHRCFLTDRTGYVVVVSTRFGDVNKQARYWLRSIESFTEGAPVVIFVNEWSEGTYYQIDEVSLRRDYPNITAVRQCSARDGEDAAFAQVVRTIQDMALANDSISMSFPEPWEKVRKKIIALGSPDSQKYYISQEEFREECRNNGIENEDIQTWLLDWFNDLGECFSYEFDEERQDLKKDLKVLDPAWLTNAIYIIIREAGDLALNGIVPHEGIQKKLDHSDKGTLKGVSYDADECDYVLEVMRKFRLSYKIPGKRQEFIPALLRDKMPADLQPTDANNVISYEMRYKYLPENVIHNLMIAMYPYLDHERCWRKGMVIDVRKILSIGLYAVLDMSREDEILRIKVYSFANHAPWQLLQEIRARLLDINSRMNLEAQDYIIIDPEHIAEAVSVEKLLKLKKRGKTYYEGDDRDYEINVLLGQTFGDEQVRRMENVDSSVNRDSDRKSDEYWLREMRDALNQPAEKGILNLTNQPRCTCETVCEYLISACTQIQSNPLYWNAKEDSRSMQVRDILSNRNLLIRDQTLHGHAPNSDNPGEIDLMVMKNTTDPLTIIEAMNIDSVNTKYIQEHLHKLLDDYNPSGLPELFLVAYVQKAKKNFLKFWESYRSFIKKTDAEDFKVVDMQDVELEMQYIKHSLVHYECGGARFAVHHICMRAGD